MATLRPESTQKGLWLLKANNHRQTTTAVHLCGELLPLLFVLNNEPAYIEQWAGLLCVRPSIGVQVVLHCQACLQLIMGTFRSCGCRLSPHGFYCALIELVNQYQIQLVSELDTAAQISRSRNFIAKFVKPSHNHCALQGSTCVVVLVISAAPPVIPSLHPIHSVSTGCRAVPCDQTSIPCDFKIDR